MLVQLFFTTAQDQNESCDAYMAYFRDAAQTLELVVFPVLIYPALKNIYLKEFI